MNARGRGETCALTCLKQEEMIMTSTSCILVAGRAGTLPANSRNHASLAFIARATRQLWHAYWDRQARQATIMLLYALDDRALADIGFKRSEIESVVLGPSSDRAQPYERTAGCSRRHSTSSECVLSQI